MHRKRIKEMGYWEEGVIRSGRQLSQICFSPCILVGRSERLLAKVPKTCFRSFKRVRMVSHAESEIQSLKNPRAKDARSLLRRRQRDKDGRILLEGQRLISDALQAGVQPRCFFYTKEALNRNVVNHELRERIRHIGSEDVMVSESVIRSFSDTVSPQGLVAIFDRPEVHLPMTTTLTLICDEIRDPGNLGTLLRSAAAAGVQAACLTTGCADIWNLKVLRSGMGAQFRLPTRAGMSWSDIAEYMRETKSEIRVAEGSSDMSYTDVNWRVPSALVVGSEADGPSRTAFEAAQQSICIPMRDGMESLNAAMAGTVILFEAQRQRSQK